MDLKSRSDARAWAVDLVDRVAVGQGWTAQQLELAYQVIEAAWDQTPYVSDPFWGVISDTGPEFFAFLAALWKTDSTFPDSWNKLQGVWVQAQATAQAQDDQSGFQWDLLADAVKKTGEDLQQTVKVGSFGLLGIGLAMLTGLILWETR